MPLSRKEKKRLYDIEYRRKNKEIIKEKKRAYYQTESGKATMKRNRQKMGTKYHSDYCRLPEQIKKRKEREIKRRHGEFRECYELTEKIFAIVRKTYPSKYERLKARGYVFNKQKLRSRFPELFNISIED